MNSPHPTATAAANDLGALLRQWRDVRGKSQLDLAFDADVSQRHISFMESGRSIPSRQTLMTVAEALDVPLRDRNALLLAAGYAPLYSEGPWNAAEMQSVTRALQRMLRQQEPFPAVVMDRAWNVLMANEAAPRFFRCFIDLAARESPRNLLRLMFDPQGMRPFIADWETVAKSLLQRVYRESVGRVVDHDGQELLAALLAYPGVKAEWKTPKALSAVPTAPDMPVIPIGFIHGDRVLNYFSMVSTVGTPQTVAAQELRVECMFPADDATERRHLQMFGDDPAA
ncbi:transcriptional regulator [Capsulimonas corticalis]|uniref:Transcriptional regulator n=1 Tax=Capsulimonas corticalis TaxID=2219043 RepID=A0A402D4K7_9BACT|nr:helix-turn-helix transcriptional regulator [Capsulimonas corticalis]BDI29169.1 transcriptional regulator [Capsulimonas corticalis]